MERERETKALNKEIIRQMETERERDNRSLESIDKTFYTHADACMRDIAHTHT